MSVWVFCRCAVTCVLLRAALSQQPADFESLVASAQQAQAKGDFEAAAGFYQRASAFHPEMAELKANLGLMYYQTNRNEQAAEAFQQAIHLNPGLAVPKLFLGLDYVKLKRFKESLPYLQGAARTKPDDIHVQVALGQAYSGLGETRLAIRSYLRVTRIDPEDAQAWYRLGVTYLEHVEADARILLPRYKNSAYVQALIAENFAEQRLFNQAAESYQKALSLPAFPPGTHAAYGFVLLHQNDLAGAEREFKGELASNTGSLVAKLGIARLEVEKGSTEQAAGQIAEIWNTDSDFLTSNVQKFTAGLAQARADDLQVSLQRLEASGELSERVALLFRSGAAETPLLVHRRSELTTSKGAARVRGGAAESYRKGAYRQCSGLLAPQLPNLSFEDLRLLALCAYATGDYDDAYQAAERLSESSATEVEGLYWEIKSSQMLATEVLAHASEIDSGSPKLHVLLGDVYRQQERFDDAEREYHKALTIQSQDSGALFGLSVALLGKRQSEDALHVAEAAIRSNPSDPEFNGVMGEILCEREDFLGAEIYLRKSLNARPEYVAHIHALLAKVYANTNRTHEAIAELKLVLPDDKDGHFHYQIGRLYLKVGDRDSAQRAFAASKRLGREGLSRAAAHLGQAQDTADFQ